MNHLFTLALLTCTTGLFAQSATDTIFFTNQWNRTNLRKIIAFYGFKDYDSTGRGMATYYFKTGELHSHQEEYKNLKEGHCIWYHKNGLVKCEGDYTNDLPNGIFEWYDENGIHTQSKTYRNDTLINIVRYDPKTGEAIPNKGVEEFPDVEAQFPGGTIALQRYIAESVIYPAEAIEMNEQGKVYVTFIIQPDGSVSEIEIVQGVSESLDAEAIRLIREMPDWIPAEKEGERVSCRIQMPVNFTIHGSGKKRKRK